MIKAFAKAFKVSEPQNSKVIKLKEATNDHSISINQSPKTKQKVDPVGVKLAAYEK